MDVFRQWELRESGSCLDVFSCDQFWIAGARGVQVLREVADCYCSGTATASPNLQVGVLRMCSFVGLRTKFRI